MTQADREGWTLETLRQHLTRVIDDADRRYEQRYVHSLREQDAKEAAARDSLRAALEAVQEAVSKAEATTARRFESVNEFRSAMQDQTSHFSTKTEMEARINDLTGQLNRLSSRITESEAAGKGRVQLWGWLVGAVGAVAIVAELITGFHR